MLVFLRRKIDADWACRQLELEGHPVEKIHSGRTQRQRVAALQGLRQGEHRILLATDIAARGIDIPIIEHIVNFGMPDTVEDYIHRAGRTARGAMSGTVSTIATAWPYFINLFNQTHSRKGWSDQSLLLPFTNFDLNEQWQVIRCAALNHFLFFV